MSKHRLMLSAAAAALLAQPVLAATTITTVGSSPIDTKTDGDITINSGGGVKINKAGAAVTVNSNNFLNNGGTISNTNTDNAKGILIDASGGALKNATGITNSGSIDMTGTGTGKTALELSGGTFTGPIILSSSSVIRIAGDNSQAVVIDGGSTLNGDMVLSGSITAAPTTPANLQNPQPVTLVNIEGAVNGNVTMDASSVFVAQGAGSRGIVVGPLGSINACNKTAVPGCTEIGTLTNAGNVTVEGIALTTGSSNKNIHPESGSAMVISGNVAGGIVNAGPSSVADSTAAAVLSSSGLFDVAHNVAAPTVLIGPNGTATSAITIGKNTADTVDKDASFINRGTIVASPLNTNNSTIAVEIAGANGFATTLSGDFVNAGTISAIASSASGSTAASVFATAIDVAPFASIPKLRVSSESNASATSSLGAVIASISGTEGGVAQAIVIGGNATLPEIDVGQFGKIKANATTSTPATTNSLNAFGIVDQSGTLTKINNAGIISATATTLTPPAGTTVTNEARAIDVSATKQAVTINDTGTITGDILLNSSGNGTVFNIGGGTAGGGDPTQTAAAALAATETGLTNDPNTVASVAGNVQFGTGTSTLNINDFGVFRGQLTALGGGALTVNVSKHGTLDLTNDTTGLVVDSLSVHGGALAIATSEALRSSGQATITATTVTGATLDPGTSLGVTIGSFVPQGTNAYVLIKTPSAGLHINPVDLGNYTTQVDNNLPFFFDKTKSSLQEKLTAAGDSLVLNLTPKTAAQLGLNGDALTMFAPANDALLNDAALGSAVVNGITSQTTAQSVYSQFAPDVSGIVRAEVVALTDQASGPVAARQRLLRSYANQGGDFTMWGQEYAQYLNNKGHPASDPSAITQSKSHGFGFVLGMDGGDPEDGWYGGAFTFLNADATETLAHNAKDQTEWYMLTGYTDWRGNHLFIDSQMSVAYGNLKGKRFLNIALPASGTGAATTLSREADGKRAGLMGAIGVTTGAIFNWGETVLMPQISLDGMTMREEGFTETGGGDGFDLQVSPYYASSLRAFIGGDVRQDFNLGDFTLQPEARLGYRYDFLNDPVKLKAAFVSTGNTFTITGPDPAQGNVVAGASIGASTDTWSMGLNFDWVRGSNGSTTEVGTVSLLGRI